EDAGVGEARRAPEEDEGENQGASGEGQGLEGRAEVRGTPGEVDCSSGTVDRVGDPGDPGEEGEPLPARVGVVVLRGHAGRDHPGHPGRGYRDGAGRAEGSEVVGP